MANQHALQINSPIVQPMPIGELIISCFKGSPAPFGHSREHPGKPPVEISAEWRGDDTTLVYVTTVPHPKAMYPGLIGFD